MVTGFVWFKLVEGSGLRHEVWGPLLGYVGTTVVAVVGTVISARLTYGILAKDSDFELSKIRSASSLRYG